MHSNEIAPEFHQLIERLRITDWFSRVGQVAKIELPFLHRFVGCVAATKKAIELPEWEDWTLERRNDLTECLHDLFQKRDAAWNAIAKQILDFLENVIIPSVSVSRHIPVGWDETSDPCALLVY